MRQKFLGTAVENDRGESWQEIVFRLSENGLLAKRLRGCRDELSRRHVQQAELDRGLAFIAGLKLVSRRRLLDHDTARRKRGYKKDAGS